MLEHIFHLSFLGLISVGIMFFLIWLLHIPLKNAGIVDVGWGIGFIILMLIYINLGAGWTLRNFIFFAMVLFWGLRISFFLIKRMLKEQREDTRYAQIRRDWGKNIKWKFLAFFEFQAVLQIVIALPLLVAVLNPRESLHVIEIVAIVIWAIGLIGETIADEQLLRFKSDLSRRGKTCDVGLWKYSRHPNYFFEWLIWVGLAVYAIPSPLGWFSPISPLIMYVLMMYFSGIPLSEQQAIRTRGEEYLRYQRVTSPFFPMPRRRIL